MGFRPGEFFQASKDSIIILCIVKLYYVSAPFSRENSAVIIPFYIENSAATTPFYIEKYEIDTPFYRGLRD
jgi:hypothetical protein